MTREPTFPNSLRTRPSTPSGDMLLRLSDELLRLCLHSLDRKGVVRCARTCRRVHRVAMPVLWHGNAAAAHSSHFLISALQPDSSVRVLPWAAALTSFNYVSVLRPKGCRTGFTIREMHAAWMPHAHRFTALTTLRVCAMSVPVDVEERLILAEMVTAQLRHGRVHRFTVPAELSPYLPAGLAGLGSLTFLQVLSYAPKSPNEAATARLVDVSGAVHLAEIDLVAEGMTAAPTLFLWGLACANLPALRSLQLHRCTLSARDASLVGHLLQRCPLEKLTATLCSCDVPSLLTGKHQVQELALRVTVSPGQTVLFDGALSACQKLSLQCFNNTFDRLFASTASAPHLRRVYLSRVSMSCDGWSIVLQLPSLHTLKLIRCSGGQDLNGFERALLTASPVHLYLLKMHFSQPHFLYHALEKQARVGRLKRAGLLSCNATNAAADEYFEFAASPLRMAPVPKS